jgi:hypothetical protein
MACGLVRVARAGTAGLGRLILDGRTDIVRAQHAPLQGHRSSVRSDDSMIEPRDIRRLNLGYFSLPATSRWSGEKVVACEA